MEVIDFLKSLKDQADAHTADIANRLRKDQADATPYTLSVGTSAAMDNAVRKSELIGGFLRPYRLFKNVSTIETSAYIRTGQDPKIIDSLSNGSAYKITNIKITAIVAAGLASTITIKSNGAVIYTQTMALVNLPVVGKVVDILGFATSQPANITLPATLTVSSSSGTFEVFIDGVLI